MKVDIKQQVAIVTGAAKGLGKAIAKVLLENGAAVFITDIIDADGRKAAKELSAFGKCRYFHMDVTRVDEVNSLITAVRNEFGRIDILVNNAGANVSSDHVNVEQFADEEWDKLIDVNLKGVFHCCRAVAKVMIEQQSGRIINIGSVLGDVPARKQIAFIAAEGGLHHMTKALAIELGQFGIQANGVAPGSIAMDINSLSDKDSPAAQLRERMLSHVPLGRFGTVEDITGSVLFLCGKESSYITGHILTVDGGWTCSYSRDF